ncbi:potassium channel family protein [bacterium]|nr:potassium channel family protein [bacterium]
MPKLKISSKWNATRILASTRVLAAIVVPLVLLSVITNLPAFSSIAYLVLACLVLGLLWVNTSTQLVRMTKINIPLRFTKVLTLLVCIILGYAMIHHALLVFEKEYMQTDSHSGNLDAIQTPDKDADKHCISTFIDMTYFSTITLASVGYGDISPRSRAARIASMTEVIIGLVLLAVFLSRAVIIPHGPPSNSK